MTLPKYRHLDEETLNMHYAALLMFYPCVEIVPDLGQFYRPTPGGKSMDGQVAWVLSMEKNNVTTERGSQYDIYLPYAFEYPDGKDPVGIVFTSDGQHVTGAPHMYAGGLICVHDGEYDRERWSPVVGMNLAICWILQYEDWRHDGREFPSVVPDDIKQRAQALIAAMDAPPMVVGEQGGAW